MGFGHSIQSAQIIIEILGEKISIKMPRQWNDRRSVTSQVVIGGGTRFSPDRLLLNLKLCFTRTSD
ncbi:hypothetical protein EB093_00160 [bacterium]|nr:hypothetical protein [bacterium]